MSLFKKEEPPKTRIYDIYDPDDKVKLDELERELEPYGNIFQLCQSKGWIKITGDENHFDYTVHPDHTEKLTDYLRRDVALKRRNKYKKL